jgi:predicted dehydrogenase/threonine dehydrogenase-like Zn-dependent dehydrogenase
MKQVLQNIANGETTLEDVPCPKPKKGHILVKSHNSLISAGTERMLVDFGKAGWIDKARSQPDKVKMVIEKTKTDGVAATYEAIKSKLDQPLPLGYCNVGTVIDNSDTDFKKGERVVSNGNHAEIVRVPRNLSARIPDNVNNETAAYTIIGSIAMQGIRLVNPAIGETVVVTGLGLIGLLAVQILKANGCKVLGIDYDSAKCELAKSFGAEVVDLSKNEDVVSIANSFSRSRGVDSVLITASSKSNDIVHQAATICRQRGKIVLVGVVGLELRRDDFYEKELSFQVSCSYGPGRYDEDYEQKGLDYPIGFVRWTEQRNFEAVLDLMSSGSINVDKLTSHTFDIDETIEAYSQLNDSKSLGILLNYNRSNTDKLIKTSVNINESNNHGMLKGNLAFIGGGNYSSRVLIPAFKRAGGSLVTLVTSGGVSAVHHGKKNGFNIASTDINSAMDASIDAVVIGTQHNLHCDQTIIALENNKHVFIEKPLALDHVEIKKIKDSYGKSNSILMVGYNRRFAPQIQKIKKLLDKKSSPKTFIMTMNAGEIPPNHWTQNKEIGGGRIIGEACHYIDLMRFLAGSKIKSFDAIKIGKNDFVQFTEDKASISLEFEDGSIGTIHYFANGGKSFPKERIEIFCDNAVLQLDNFRKLKGFGWKGFRKMNLWSQDKGQDNCVKAFMNSIKNGEESPIPHNEIFEVASISVDIAERLRK